MTLLPAAPVARGSAIIARLEAEGVQLPVPLQTTLAGMADRRALESQERERRDLVAQVVFAYYCVKLDHPRALYTPARELTLVRLLITFHDDASVLLYAVDGVRDDDWVMGRSPKQPRRLESFSWLFEEGGVDRIERYAETIPAYKKEKLHPLVVRHNLPTGDSE